MCFVTDNRELKIVKLYVSPTMFIVTVTILQPTNLIIVLETRFLILNTLKHEYFSEKHKNNVANQLSNCNGDGLK